MPPADPDVDPRLLVALGHPVRQQMLMVLADTPATIAALAERTEAGLPAVRRHMSVLLANDAVEPVDSEGAPDERRYRLMIRPFLDDAHWRELPPHRRAALFAVTLRRIAAQVDKGLADEDFGHEQTHVSLTRLQLDEQGWQELTDLLAGVLEEAMQIEAESAERTVAGKIPAPIESKLAILHFGRR
jgi:DNA-binding transcriptional ArsR family regulator